VPAQKAVDLVPLFAGLKARDRRRIAQCMRERSFDPGEALVAEGEGGIAFFVIEEGEVEVSVGGRPVRTLGPGDYFGEMALIDGDTRTASVTGRTEGRCHAMVAWEFRALVKNESEIAWELMRTLVGRVRETAAVREQAGGDLPPG
jgi:CRP-like cAMP-binding protein